MEQNTPTIGSNDNLAKAVELMSKSEEEFLPVVSATEKSRIIGLLTYKDVLTAYKIHLKENQEAGINLSLKRQRIKILVRGRQLIHKTKD
ncbi:CBS domain-containing protein [Pedobacter steynii]